MNVQERYLDAGSPGAHMPSRALTRVLGRIPDDIRAGFTRAQLIALDGALDANNPRRHPVNLRVTLFGIFYVVVLAGREQRSRARRAVEREKHPLHTPGNLLLLALIGLLGLAVGYALRVLVFGG
jgi:hypothetical protein